jgi:hypothetical protein
MTLYRAARLHKIPKATLFKHVKGMRGVKAKRCVDQLLSKIAVCLKLMEKWGFGLPRKEVLGSIGRYVNENKIPTPSEEEYLVLNILSALKECISEVSKSHKALKHAEKRVSTHS